MKSLFKKFGIAMLLPVAAAAIISCSSGSDEPPVTPVKPVGPGPEKPGVTLAQYNVQHYQQNIENDEYTLVEADTETQAGTIGTKTEAVAKEYPGFTAKAFEQADIEKDGSTAVSIYYDRNIITITFDVKGGSAVGNLSGKYGATVAAPASPEKTGYTFAGWSPALPEKFLEDGSYTATWGGAPSSYTVKHYQQNIENDEYALVEADTQNLEGLTATQTAAEAKNYEGFTAKTIEQAEILADGSTVVLIYYDRNIVTITVDVKGGSAVENLSGKFGSTVAAPASPAKAGYTFAGWTPAVPEIFSENLSLAAEWTPAASTYTVKHYQQNIEDDEYTLVEADTETLDGTTEDQTAAEAKVYEGFTAKTFEQTEIAGDGSTVVSIYYDRRHFTVTFDTNGGVEVDPVSAKYGESVSAPEGATKAGYVLHSWSKTFPFTVTEDVTVTAVWELDVGNIIGTIY